MTAPHPRPAADGAAFLALLLVNAVAVYAPGAFWVASLGGAGRSYLFSPVALPLVLAEVNSPGTGACVLGAFLAAVVLASLLLRRSLWGWTAVPAALFALCLAQGLYAARLLTSGSAPL